MANKKTIWNKLFLCFILIIRSDIIFCDQENVVKPQCIEVNSHHQPRNASYFGPRNGWCYSLLGETSVGDKQNDQCDVYGRHVPATVADRRELLYLLHRGNKSFWYERKSRPLYITKIQKELWATACKDGSCIGNNTFGCIYASVTLEGLVASSCSQGGVFTLCRASAVCPAGFECNLEHDVCVRCRPRHYQDGSNHKCHACPDNAATVLSGESCACREGHYLKGGVCEPCPVDSYKSSVGNDTTCQLCQSGSIPAGTGKTSADDCFSDVKLTSLTVEHMSTIKTTSIETTHTTASLRNYQLSTPRDPKMNTPMVMVLIVISVSVTLTITIVIIFLLCFHWRDYAPKKSQKAKTQETVTPSGLRVRSITPKSNANNQTTVSSISSVCEFSSREGF